MLSSAPIFLTSHYFRQNIWPRVFVQFHSQDIFEDEMTATHITDITIDLTSVVNLLKAAVLDMSPFDLL